MEYAGSEPPEQNKTTLIVRDLNEEYKDIKDINIENTGATLNKCLEDDKQPSIDLNDVTLNDKCNLNYQIKNNKDASAIFDVKDVNLEVKDANLEDKDVNLFAQDNKDMRGSIQDEEMDKPKSARDIMFALSMWGT